MTLRITSQWEHDIFGASDGISHLVVTVSAAESTSTVRAPIDLAFALDRSGSMAGQNKLELVKTAVIAAVEQMQETDRVSLVTFDNEVETRHDLKPVDADHRRHLERVTNAIAPGGSTNLSGGWLEACRQISEMAEGSPRIRRTLLLTDGMANVGITDPRALSKHAKELRDRGISTSAIGVGEGFDEFLLSGISEAGGGNFQYIADPAELEQFFSDELRSLAETVAMNPYLEVTMPHGMRAELVNAFPSESHRRHTTIDLRDLAAGEDVNLVFAVRAKRQPEESITPDLHLHWTNPQSGHIDEINQTGTTIAIGDTNKAVRNDAAAAIVALELAARDHREAVELDRAGRYHDSREQFRNSAARLQAAPATEEVLTYMKTANEMSMMDEYQPMSEHDRKSRVHESHQRSRGGRRHDHGERPQRVSGGDHCHVTKREVRFEMFREAGEAMRGEGRRQFGERHDHGPRRGFFREAGEAMRGESRRHFGEHRHHDESEAPRFERHPHRGEGRGFGRRREMFREAGEAMRGEGRRHFGERHDHGPRREFFREAGEAMRGESRRHFGERFDDERDFGSRDDRPCHHKGGPRRVRGQRSI